jgi:hypothetical protein
MANLNRNEHNLRTIRITYEPTRKGAKVWFCAYHGSYLLAEQVVNAEDIGLQSELTVKAYWHTKFKMDSVIFLALANVLLENTEPDEPLWLQIGKSAGHLAVVPWERILQPVLRRPLLRVPNFVEEPLFSAGPLRIILCVSSPRAKTPFNAVDYAWKFINKVRDSIPDHSSIHIFADLEDYDQLRDMETFYQPRNFHEVMLDRYIYVHNPHEADAFGKGGTDQFSEFSKHLSSPWLLWMASALNGKSVDAVHFVCPGYFWRDSGALALARSPGENVDRDWAHFVGADELMTFLDLVGARTTGFSPPYEDVWAIGLRLLADRLAWERPGPLFLHDTEHGSFEDMRQVYSFLFSAEYQELPSVSTLMLYSHPECFFRHSGASATFLSGMKATIPFEEEEKFIGKMTSFRDHMELPCLAENEPVWLKAWRNQIKQKLFGMKDQDHMTQLGMIDALQKIESYMKDHVITKQVSLKPLQGEKKYKRGVDYE